jgi:hypothetical protein
MNLMMVLNNDFEDNSIHFEELFNSCSTKTKKEVYITIISTNINALLINWKNIVYFFKIIFNWSKIQVYKVKKK